MCGTIKYECTGNRIGHVMVAVRHQPIDVIRQDGSSLTVKWLGHSREESGLPRLPHEEVKILATGFTEKGTFFCVPEKKAIKAYLIKSKNYPGGCGVFLVTRQAKTVDERHVHDRFPLIIDR